MREFNPLTVVQHTPRTTCVSATKTNWGPRICEKVGYPLEPSTVQRRTRNGLAKRATSCVSSVSRGLDNSGEHRKLKRMRSLLACSVVTTLVACKVTCDAFHVHSAVRSTSLRFERRRSGVGVTMKDSVSTTAESLRDLREVQKANGGVVGDAIYEDGERADIMILAVCVMIRIYHVCS